MRDLYKETDALLERALAINEGAGGPHGVGTREILFLEMLALVVVAIERQTKAVYATAGIGGE